MSQEETEDKGFRVIDRRGSTGDPAGQATNPAPPAEPQSAPADESKRVVPRVDFSMLVQSFAFSALHSLGLVRDRDGGPPTAPDIPLARHNIELLELLEEKTRGNLSAEESHLLASLLYEVRMHFVEATKPRSG